MPGDRSRWYWREAPLLGLIGESQIVVTPRGVASETVAYDLNISSDALRDCGPAAPDRLVALRCPRARAHH